MGKLSAHFGKSINSRMRSRGLEIGTDISVIAGCDSELAQLTTPATTVIR
jgi:DNA-binding LacI/PurR family transcriptional regulator